MKKNFSLRITFLFVIVLLGFGCSQNQTKLNKSWTFGPFVKVDSVNPIMGPIDSVSFVGPILKKQIKWEAKDVFNPACIVRKDTVFLLYRAEDSIGRYNGTSRIGLAYSLDGLHFVRYSKPVLYPENDKYKKYEWEGGCEDPRIVQDSNGTYYMTYTAYDGHTARLFIATSTDLRHWKKHGSVFKKAGNEYVNMWSKSGAIVCKDVKGKLVAAKINGKYWMFWGESNIYIATSKDLINWTPVVQTNPAKQKLDKMRGYKVPFKILFSPRKGHFDSELVESGPPAVITKNGIVFLYNSKNSPEFGTHKLAPGTYAAGQVLVDKNNPEKVLKRTDKWFISPNKPYEITGQVNNVCFVEGQAYFHNKWFLYYGTADSKIAVAVYTPKSQKTVKKKEKAIAQ